MKVEFEKNVILIYERPNRNAQKKREILQARTSPGSADSFSYDSADAVELVVRWWHCSADLFKNKNNRYLILKHLIKCNCTIQSIKFCAYEHALVELPANWMTCNRSNKQSNANQSKKWYTVAFPWTANSHYWQTLHKHKKIKNICLKTMVSTHLKQRDWLLLSESHLSIFQRLQWDFHSHPKSSNIFKVKKKSKHLKGQLWPRVCHV